MIFGSDTRTRRDLARPLRGPVKERLSSDMMRSRWRKPQACRRDALVVMKKTPPIKSVVVPLDLIGGPADQGAFEGGRDRQQS